MFNYKRVARLEAKIATLRELLWNAFYESNLSRKPYYDYELYFENYDSIEARLKKSIENKKKIEADREQEEKIEALVRQALDKIKETTPAGAENV